MFVVGCFISQVIGYFLACLPYFIMDMTRTSSSVHYKIQKKTYPTKWQIVQSSKDMLVSFTTVILPMLAFGGLVIRHLGISRDGPLPSSFTILLQLVFFFLVEDYLNYWIHRWLHLPWLYRHIHSVHHEYDSPFAIVAAYAHPVEVILQAIPTFVGPFVIGPHLYTLMLWQICRNCEAIDIHSGYDLPYSLKSLIPSYAGARHHDYHHYMHSGNFASVFTWCDRIYGTDLGYHSYISKNLNKDST